jgi:hypothetical protein
VRGNIPVLPRQLTAYADEILITARTKESLIDTFQQLTNNSMKVGLIKWEDNIKQDICQIKIRNWITLVQDRGNWKEVVEKDKALNWDV